MNRGLFVVFILFISCVFCSPFTIKEKITKSQKGDFIVTEQAKNYSLLSIHSFTENSLILEEITVPCAALNPSKISWQEWLNAKAPGHSSWTLYKIDLAQGKLKECYSPAKQSWLLLDHSEYFFSKLISLALTKTPLSQRKRIGPAPENGTADQRALWNPPLIIQGKKREKPRFESYKASWPKDNTPLSQTEIELYFDVNTPSFAFPHWIEIKGAHYILSIQTIDSGSGLISPISDMPRRSPEFIGSIQESPQGMNLTIKYAQDGQHMQLFVVDLSDPKQEYIPIIYTYKPASDPETSTLEISRKELSKHLIQGHLYRFLALMQNGSGGFTETRDTFLWP